MSNNINELKKRRLRFLEEDKEMFGLTSSEENELAELKQESY